MKNEMTREQAAAGMVRALLAMAKAVTQSEIDQLEVEYQAFRRVWLSALAIEAA